MCIPELWHISGQEMIILDFGNIGKKKGAHMALLKLSGGRQYNRMIQVRVKMQSDLWSKLPGTILGDNWQKAADNKYWYLINNTWAGLCEEHEAAGRLTAREVERGAWRDPSYLKAVWSDNNYLVISSLQNTSHKLRHNNVNVPVLVKTESQNNFL